MTRLKSHTLPLLFLFFVMLYMSIGLGYNGLIVLPRLEPFTFGVFLLGAIFAGVQHLRGRWRFYHSPLTAMVALWVLAIGISFVANPHIWRVSLEAIWYIGLFIGVMAFFTGALTNRAFSRQTVEEAFLLLGLVMMAIGYAQTFAIASQGRHIPLIGSLVIIPNYYAMLLMMVAVLALHRALASRLLVARLMMGLYVLAALGQLWLTDSRGGMLGFLAAVSIYAILWFITAPAPGISSPFARLDAAIRQRTGLRLMWIVVISGLLGSVIVLGLLVILIQRGILGPRAELYTIALNRFLEKPITGFGWFSYGESSMALLSRPHVGVFIQAHSVVFNVMAELGLLGLAALVYSIITGIRAIIANRHVLTMPELRGYDALVAVLVGLSVHQLLDVAQFYVAWLIVIFITLVITPVAPRLMTQPMTRRGLIVALAGLLVGLVLGVQWHVPILIQYSDLLQDLRQQQAAGEIDYPNLTQRFQTLIDLDPENRAYRLQYAALLGERAYETDTTADIDAAIQAYQDALELMPYLAVGRSNLASLYWQAGDMAAASATAATAASYADSWQLPRWQYWAYSQTQSIPWLIQGSEKHYFAGSLVSLYTRGIADPIVLDQVIDSITLSPNDIRRGLLHSFFVNRLWLFMESHAQ